MGPMSIDKWRIPVENENTLQSTAGLETDDSFVIEGIYVSSVALLVHMRIKSEPTQGAIGRVLRFVGCQAEMFGFILPCLGVLETPSAFAEKLRRWAADQDWHRGDFALFVVEQPAKQETREQQEGLGETYIDPVIQRLLGSTFVTWGEVPQLKPLTQEEYVDRVRDECSTSNIAEEHRNLLKTIISAAENDEPIEQAVEQWLKDQLERVESLIEGDDGDA